MIDYHGLHFPTDIEKNLKKLGYTSLRAMLEAEYPKHKASYLASQMEVCTWTIHNWLRKFNLARKGRGGFNGERLKKAKTKIGRPCKLGHTLRYVSDRACVECVRIRNIALAEKRRNQKNGTGT